MRRGARQVERAYSGDAELTRAGFPVVHAEGDPTRTRPPSTSSPGIFEGSRADGFSTASGAYKAMFASTRRRRRVDTGTRSSTTFWPSFTSENDGPPSESRGRGGVCRQRRIKRR